MRIIMVIKKIFLLTAGLISIIIIGNKIFNDYTYSTPQYQLYVDTDLSVEKQKFKLNEFITFKLLYRQKSDMDKNIKIDFCSKENEQVEYHLLRDRPINYKEIFPSEYWINNLSFSDRVYSQFQ